jgi:ATP adenylyltransferase
MPVVGLTRVLPQVLAETRTLMAAAWGEHAGAAAPREA